MAMGTASGLSKEWKEDDLQWNKQTLLLAFHCDFSTTKKVYPYQLHDSEVTFQSHTKEKFYLNKILTI
jgi:hypothetical protein